MTLKQKLDKKLERLEELKKVVEVWNSKTQNFKSIKEAISEMSEIVEHISILSEVIEESEVL